MQLDELTTVRKNLETQAIEVDNEFVWCILTTYIMAVYMMESHVLKLKYQHEFLTEVLIISVRDCLTTENLFCNYSIK